MSEKVPSLTINLANGRKLEMTPSNSSLYTFLGETALGDTTIDNSSVNHVFVTTEVSKDGQARGMYFFREFDDAYVDMARHMTEYRYPMVLNQRNVPDGDLKAWQERLDQFTSRFGSQLPDSPDV